MRDSPYHRRASRAQTNSLDLMKINNVTSNVKQAEPSKTNKITKVLATAPKCILTLKCILQVGTSLETKCRDKDEKW